MKKVKKKAKALSESQRRAQLLLVGCGVVRTASRLDSVLHAVSAVEQRLKQLRNDVRSAQKELAKKSEPIAQLDLYRRRAHGTAIHASSLVKDFDGLVQSLGILDGHADVLYGVNAVLNGGVHVGSDDEAGEPA